MAFPKETQAKLAAILASLEKFGYLREPGAKRINEDLFEVRVGEQWRAFYAYIGKSVILILSAFGKMTQKTPERELKKALKRLKEHV